MLEKWNRNNLDKKGHMLHEDLFFIVNEIINRGFNLNIEGLGRTFGDHIRIYKNIAKKAGKPFNIDDVPMGSRHLPCWSTTKLRALDFDIYNPSTKDYLTSDECVDLVNNIRGDIKVGMGLHAHTIHLDVDRRSDAIWLYGSYKGKRRLSGHS